MTEKLRPPPPVRFRFVKDKPRASSGSLFFTNRPELHEVLAAPRDPEKDR